jgi:acyl-CoA synthetase (AMP-forming)/AMP-acid ligase II/thioesterase domain-containing protein/acyl carrier protein
MNAPGRADPVAPDPALLDLPGHAALAAPERGLLAWLAAGGARFGDQPAVEGLSGRPPLSHAVLHRTIAGFADSLLVAGIGRGAVVATALPNGPAALTALLGVAAVAVALPLAPEEPAAAVAPLLTRVPVQALLVEEGNRGGPVEAAEAAGLPVFELARPGPDVPAGTLRLLAQRPAAQPAAPSQVADAAIIVRTAGTTREAKLVAWSQASLHLSSEALAGWLGLGPQDRSLCVMPFAHLHSMVRSCLPVLLRGGAVVCAPGFDPVRILRWIEAARPTFLTAVPGILRGILARAEEGGWRPPPGTLRLLASGSDALDAPTAERLAATLGVMVREFYGMSEVAPMLAGSAPGRLARAGGVTGLATPPWTVAALNEKGEPLPPGREGELAARGGLVNPLVGGDASQRRRGPWFLTGDRGRVRADGAILVAGRVDDRINRGGRKIAPEAIETALAEHPSVRQAVVFPIPEPVLGERVGALIVPAPGPPPDPALLRAFLALRLAEDMIPERILLRDALPVSAAGKVARRGLAGVLGLTWQAAAGAGRTLPANPTEAALARIAAVLLDVEAVDLDADFDAIGLSSFLALGLVVEIEEQLGQQVSPAGFVASHSIAALARLLDSRSATPSARRVVAVRTGTAGRPVLFLAHGVDGSASYFNQALHHVGHDIEIHALEWQRPPEQGPLAFDAHAAGFLDQIRAVRPHGPYALLGHSLAGHLAFTIAGLLAEAGEAVAFLALMDSMGDQYRRERAIRRRALAARGTRDVLRHMQRCNIPIPFPGDLWLYRAAEPTEWALADPDYGWRELIGGQLTARTVPGDHHSMLGRDATSAWMGELRLSLDTAWQAALAAPPEQAAARLAAIHAYRSRRDVAAATAARIAAKEGDLRAEIAGYRAAVASGLPQPYWVHRNLAEALAEFGDLDAAIVAARVALGLEAVPILGHGILGTLLAKAGRLAEAEESFAAAEALGSVAPLTQRALARVDQMRGRLDQAERRMRQLTEAAPTLQHLWTLADILRRQDRATEALEVMRRAQKLYPFQVGVAANIEALTAQLGEGVEMLD